MFGWIIGAAIDITIVAALFHHYRDPDKVAQVVLDTLLVLGTLWLGMRLADWVVARTHVAQGPATAAWRALCLAPTLIPAWWCDQRALKHSQRELAAVESPASRGTRAVGDAGSGRGEAGRASLSGASSRQIR